MAIEPPSIFAPHAEWRRFLMRMERVLQKDPGNSDAEFYADQAREALTAGYDSDPDR